MAVPVRAEFLRDIEVRVFDGVRWAFDLDIAAGAEIQLRVLRQFQHQLLDEGGDVVIGAHAAFELLDAEYLGRHLDLHILLHHHLAGQPFARGGLAFVDMRGLGGQDIAASRVDLDAALTAGAAPAAGRGYEHSGVGQGVEQFQADRHGHVLFTVQGEGDVARGDQLGARQQDDAHQQQHDGGEQGDTQADL